MYPCVRRIFGGSHLSPIGSIMFPAYVASRDFLDRQSAQLGVHHSCVAMSAEKETLHLCTIFRQCVTDREDVNRLLECIHNDKSIAFNKEQKDSLVVAASQCLSSAISTHTDGQGGQKLQTNLHSFSYYTVDQWATFTSLDPMETKFNEMARAWLGWGLVYPSGPTFRVGLATLIVASGTKIGPIKAHQLMGDFKTLFGDIRKRKPGRVTFQIFPPQASAFQSVYPDLLPSCVDSRVSTNDIEDLATSVHIPINANNQRLVCKTSPAEVGRAADGQGSSLVQSLVASILEHRSPPPSRSPSSSPPPDRREQAFHRCTTSEAEGAGGAPTLPTPLALGNANHGASHSSVEKKGNEVPPTVADVERKAKVARRERLDPIDALIITHVDNKGTLKKEEAAAKKAAAKKEGSSKKRAMKAAAKTGTSDEEGSSDED